MEPDVVGIAEVAAMAGVSRSAVTNWRFRDRRFPSPLAELASGPVFRRQSIQQYLEKRGARMGYVISSINLKGGVGKTTTTVALAEILSAEYGKRVLVIDLDPQTNATTVLIGEQKWKELNDAGLTLATLFQDALRPEHEEPRFDLDRTLQRRVSSVSDVRTVDLLPSSLDLIDVQDRLGSMPSGRFYSNNPTDLLRRATKSLISEYEYVLVDCPPNLGIVTLNGLRMSDGFIIPTIPDVLSTYGIPQILKRVSEFAEDLSHEIVPVGIVITKYREASTLHRNTSADLRRRGNPPVFATSIPEANAIAESAEHAQINTLRQKYKSGKTFESLNSLTREFMKELENRI